MNAETNAGGNTKTNTETNTGTNADASSVTGRRRLILLSRKNTGA